MDGCFRFSCCPTILRITRDMHVVSNDADRWVPKLTNLSTSYESEKKDWARPSNYYPAWGCWRWTVRASIRDSIHKHLSTPHGVCFPKSSAGHRQFVPHNDGRAKFETFVWAEKSYNTYVTCRDRDPSSFPGNKKEWIIIVSRLHLIFDLYYGVHHRYGVILGNWDGVRVVSNDRWTGSFGTW